MDILSRQSTFSWLYLSEETLSPLKLPINLETIRPFSGPQLDFMLEHPFAPPDNLKVFRLFISCSTLFRISNYSRKKYFIFCTILKNKSLKGHSSHRNFELSDENHWTTISSRSRQTGDVQSENFQTVSWCKWLFKHKICLWPWKGPNGIQTIGSAKWGKVSSDRYSQLNILWRNSMSIVEILYRARNRNWITLVMQGKVQHYIMSYHFVESYEYYFSWIWWIVCETLKLFVALKRADGIEFVKRKLCYVVAIGVGGFVDLRDCSILLLELVNGRAQGVPSAGYSNALDELPHEPGLGLSVSFSFRSYDELQDSADSVSGERLLQREVVDPTQEHFGKSEFRYEHSASLSTTR